MEEILKQFPDLSDNQILQFQKLQSLYEDWNAKINVISRKDIDELYTRHVLHSLGIAKIIEFRPGSKIMGEQVVVFLEFHWQFCIQKLIFT